ncbi:glycosyltransferase family 4 protein [Desulfuribacillus stibiiarsenatis]|nr:glycosyltransferase family 4 protein [Desulfuribacillus stibiiarsenatis]
MRKKVCIVASSEMTIKAFLLYQIKETMNHYDVTVIVNAKPDFLDQYNMETSIITVAIQRRISLVDDVKALFQMITIFKKKRFDIVHSYTPKAGMLAMIAAWVNRIPIRIHTFTGQVWATRTGVGRIILKLADTITASTASYVIADSPSQMEYITEQGVVSQRKSSVIGKGSVTGIDIDRFQTNTDYRSAIREALQLPNGAFVFLFLGRLNRDKGVIELTKAFNQLCEMNHDSYLLIVGPDEEDMLTHMQQLCSQWEKRVRYVQYTSLPEAYMNASDVLCLPSYREGFGNVIIEAASVGIPAIGSNIYGVSDAIENGITGLLFEKGNWQELYQAMLSLYSNQETTKKLGEQAKERVYQHFRQEHVVGKVLHFYEQAIYKVNNERNS